VWVSVRGWQRRQSQVAVTGAASAPLSANEEARLRAILGDSDGKAPRE
jgi:hypothetical protein